MKGKKIIISFLISACLLNISCGSDDNNLNPEDSADGTETEDVNDNNNSENSVDFTSALLKTLSLSEVDVNLNADRITINQPELINGIPQEKGEITIELKHNDIEKFSLKQVDFNTSEFTISPALGEKKIIPGEKITYTITSTKDAKATLLYDVLVIVKDIPPHSEELNINGLSFLKANNPSLSDDITAIEVRAHTGQSYGTTIMVIVPNGTDFSNLVPTLDYEGSSIKYTTQHYGNHADFTNFSEGSSVDFKFPNIIAFQIHNSDESRYKEYRVLVEVKDIITFDAESVTLNEGAYVSFYNTYDNVIGFTYNGNYPITSSLSDPEIVVTKTPETEAKNYYVNIFLNEDNPDDNDDILNNGEKGKLSTTVNFPGSFPGSYNGFSEYVVDATFNPILKSYATPNASNNFGGLANLNFMIYNPIKIELVANVFVSQ